MSQEAGSPQRSLPRRARGWARTLAFTVPSTAVGLWGAVALLRDFRVDGGRVEQTLSLLGVAALSQVLTDVVRAPVARAVRRANQRNLQRSHSQEEPDLWASDWEFFAPVRRQFLLMAVVAVVKLVMTAVVAPAALWLAVGTVAALGGPVTLADFWPVFAAAVVTDAVRTPVTQVLVVLARRWRARAAILSLVRYCLCLGGLVAAMALLGDVSLVGGGGASRMLTVAVLAAVVSNRPIGFTLSLPIPGAATVGRITRNALVLWLASWLSSLMELTLWVTGFWTFVLAGLILSAVSPLVDLAEGARLVPARDRYPRQGGPPTPLTPQSPSVFALRTLIFSGAAMLTVTQVVDGIRLSGPGGRQAAALLVLTVLYAVPSGLPGLFTRVSRKRHRAPTDRGPGSAGTRAILGCGAVVVALAAPAFALWLGDRVCRVWDLPLRVDGFWPLAVGFVVLNFVEFVLNWLWEAAAWHGHRERGAHTIAVRFAGSGVGLWLATLALGAARWEPAPWWRQLLCLAVLASIFKVGAPFLRARGSGWAVTMLPGAVLAVGSNALMLWFVSWFSTGLRPALSVAGAGTFLLAALLITAVTWLMTALSQRRDWSRPGPIRVSRFGPRHVENSGPFGLDVAMLDH